MQKNSFYFLFNSLLYLLLFILTIVLPEGPLDTGMVYFGGLWVILILLGSMITCEQSEGKSKGYEFLKTLPIKDSQIVKAKFFLVFLTACFVVMYVKIIYQFVSRPPEVFAISQVFVPLCAVFGLLLTALIYILVFKWGLSKAIKAGWIIYFVFIFGAILFIRKILIKLDIDAEKISIFINSVSFWIWIILGLGVLAGYFGLMSVAINSKKRSRG